GVDKVEKIVKQFYHHNVTVEETRLFFKGINIERLERMQTLFLVHLLGGKQINTRKMRAAHKRLLDLNDANFDAVLANLRRACEDLEVPEELLERIMMAAETTRDDVLGR
ncbi:globin-like protein, partial [Basidiobolus meristosporus CBS 931.73]